MVQNGANLFFCTPVARRSVQATYCAATSWLQFGALIFFNQTLPRPLQTEFSGLVSHHMQVS